MEKDLNRNPGRKYEFGLDDWCYHWIYALHGRRNLSPKGLQRLDLEPEATRIFEEWRGGQHNEI
ncbi:MAG: hypothetical protein PHC91_06200, partial [Eubacteriales bacterium]|nr:hypothetical protein [Eubacteriales bacterium]